MGHCPERIAVAFARAPGAQLRREVGRGLPGKRGIAASGTLAARSMASGARLDSAFGIPLEVQRGRSAILDRTGGAGRERQLGVVGGKALPRGPIHPLRDPTHLRMAALAAGEGLHLPREVPRVEAGEAGDEVSVPLAAQPVASDARPLRARISAAQRDQLTGRLEAVLDRLGRGASAKHHGKREER